MTPNETITLLKAQSNSESNVTADTGALARPRILIIDSYDSFTNNLAALVHKAVPNGLLHIIRNDQFNEFQQLKKHLSLFSAIIVGPGPGSPDNASDVGLIHDLWHVSTDSLLPIFGVCLGLQSLGVEFGAHVRRLAVVKHGMRCRIQHSGDELFEGISDANVVRYHSLHVTLEEADCLEPLAYADDGTENGKIIMALKHTYKPFWAVQFHPESVLTDDSGLRLLKNFWGLASKWTRLHSRKQRPWTNEDNVLFGRPWSEMHLIRRLDKPIRVVSTRVLPLHNITTNQICEALGVLNRSRDFVVLDSAAHPGRFCIIGCLHDSSRKLSFTIGDNAVLVETTGSRSTELLGDQDIWSWLSRYMQSHRASGGDPQVPFWGGLIGTLSYEIGVHTIDCHLRHRKGRRHDLPDVNLVFVERSIIVDTLTSRLFIQSIISDDQEWLSSTESLLSSLLPESELSHSSRHPSKPNQLVTRKIAFPDKNKYIAGIKEAKENLFAGESYELCLTARTHVFVPKAPDAHRYSWNLYKTLRHVNPAPYAAYIRIHPLTLLSSSPERFLSFSRPPNQRCQLRPIKGTVRKSKTISREEAEAILHSPKEMAENLMIVDLIRHDLHGVVGPNVDVKQFCGVEEYETVWQSVSVVEGDGGSEASEVGWEALKRSLPPGSMTGAPKKRSVDILQELEDDERGVYSGVFGYWCVGGSGDWAIAIRSCYKIDNTAVPRPGLSNGTNGTNVTNGHTILEDVWTLGSGGAITALSEPEAEWDEMIVKLESVLRAFGAVQNERMPSGKA